MSPPKTPSLRWAWGLLALLLLPALAQARTDLKGIVPGSQLGWEIEELRAGVVVNKPTILNLQIYSPGFDPQDYRRALKGQEELGDERYDRGRGSLRAEFVLTHNNQVLAEKTFGLEPHRWVPFFRGEVQPGVYLIKSRFQGLGKNAFRYRIQTSVPEAAELVVDPTLQLYDVRRATANPVSVATIRGGDWSEPFVLDVSPQALPLRVGFYDEDGPKELEGRVRLPDGRVAGRPVSGDRSWAYYDVRQPGTFTFGFRQPRGAAQYSNTIGFRVEACMEVEPRAFRVVAPRPVQALVQDLSGQPVQISPIVEGDKVRTVRLPALPEGYRLVRLELEGGEALDAQTARFGCAGGQARFVVEKPAPQSVLEMEAVLVRPDGEQPFDLPLLVNEKPVLLQKGQARLELPPGTYALTPQLSGARIEGPSEVRLESAQTQRVRYRIYPEVRLELEAAPTLLRVGEQTTLTARARSAFPDLLPADLELTLPPCLEPLDPTRLTAPVGQGRDVVLRVPARATCKAEPEPIATLAPWSGQARTRLKILQPATFALKKEALTPRVEVGGEAIWRLAVENTGDEAGRVRLEDGPARFDQTFELSPGERRTFQVRSPVTADAPERIVNTARLLDAWGAPLDQAQAEVQVLRPSAQLSRTLDKRIVVPGETVEVRLVVRNAGQAPLRYGLRDTYPEWLDPDTTPEFSGELAPGESATHTYLARVRLGPPTSGGFLAQLSSDGGNPRAADTLQRSLVGLEQSVEPGRVLVGGQARFTVRVGNPTDHPLSLRLQESPAEGLKMALPESLEFALQPGEVRELALLAQAERAGALEAQALALVGGAPASFPARATLLALPPLEPQRLSSVELPFEVKGAAAGERLLITHQPPAGSTYEPGSARLDGRPLPDPRVDGQGRLYFEIPYQTSGLLSFGLRHREALGAPAEPTLTVRVGDREVYLQGQQPYADYDKALPIEVKAEGGLIQEPRAGTLFRVDKIRVVLQTPLGLETRLTLNGEEVDSKNLGQATYDSGTGLQRLEYYGLPLRPGRNLIQVQTPAGSDRVEVFLAGPPVRLEVRPVRLVADGRTPLELEVRALDALGLPAGFGAVTAQTSSEPLEPDAFPLLSGYQVLLKDGQARLRLKPLATPGPLRLELAYNTLETAAEFFVPGARAALYQYQGSLGVRLGGTVQAFGNARAYLEAPLGQGSLQGALDLGGLAQQVKPDGRFPLLGSGEEAKPALRSDDPIALRYDEPRLSLGYYAEALSLPGVRDLPSATALRGEWRGDLSVKGFAALLSSATRTREITPDGTRIYPLGEGVLAGSERVVLQEGPRETTLERLKDYTLDWASGTLVLAKPLWPTTPDFQPVRLRVTYAPEDTPRDRIGLGVGLEYRSGGWRFGLGLAQLDRLRWGAEVGYEGGGLSVGARYSYDGGSRFGLEGRLQGEGWEGRAGLSVDGKVQGSARVAALLGNGGKVALEHVGDRQNQTALLYEQALSPAFTLGGGLAYTWETGGLGALLRGRYQEGGASLQLSHIQPFSLSQGAVSRLDARYPLDANLSAEASVSYTWGADLFGSLGLKQRLGNANLALSYQLPGASGEGNRARFGLEAPLPLDEHWSLNLSAGYERSLSSGADGSAFGLAARYTAQGFNAGAGTEVAFGNGQAKLTFRGGAAGTWDPRQSLSLDATYQVLPSAEGRFTVAYALHADDLTLLTYGRLSSGAERTLEGEAALTYLPAPSFGLRPSLAYRLKLDDPVGNTYQLGLGGTYYLGRFGIGGALYRTFTPALGAAAWAWSLEGSYRLLEGVWLAAGYNFGGGLTLREGFYLRLDFLGGSR
ncbi:MAG: hypothetical protein C4327_05385 [Meiothermus sp.]